MMEILAHTPSLLICGSATVLTYAFARGPALGMNRLGHRGAMRRRAISEGGWFALLEPAVRFLAARVGTIPPQSLRRGISTRLHLAGDWLGLTVDEFFALSVVSGCAGGVVGAVFSQLVGVGWAIVLGLAFVAACLPLVELDHAKNTRFREVDRDLPGAIDLAAMCVGAGLDFPGALQKVVRSGARASALHVEICRVLQELSLG